MKLFNPDSRIMIFLSRVADLVILNILWLVCCIPVVTIGASTTAMYHVIRHWQKDSVSSIMRDFFQSFKEDFKQATPVYLILLIPTVAVVMNAMLIFNPENSAAVPSYLLVIWFISALILLFISSFVYPVMAFFADTLFKTLRNAMVLALANLPRTILISILNLLPVRPMDGGRILWLAAAYLTEPYTADRVAAAVGLAVSSALFLLCLWLVLTTGNGVFLLLGALWLVHRSLPAELFLPSRLAKMQKSR